jgi:hypothetical protein
MSLKDKIQTCFYMLLFIVGAIVCGAYFIQSIRWHLISEHTIGEYTGTYYTSHRTGLFVSNFVSYKYTVNDVDYTGNSTTSVDPNGSDRPTVYYDPSDPKTSSLDGSISWVCFIFGTLFLSAFALIL